MPDDKNPFLHPFLQKTPWERSESSIWPTSVFILRRNLSRQLFPGKMHEQQSSASLEIIQEAICRTNILQQPQFIPANALFSTEKELIAEHFFLANAVPCPAIGQGFVIDSEGHHLVQINGQDHLTCYFNECNMDWKESWQKLTRFESHLNQELNFAYDAKFGYLTADPGNCGTALEIQIFLHLPALIHTDALEATLVNEKEVEILSITGQTKEMIGDLVIIKNRYTLGMTEEAILHTMHKTATKILSLEKKQRDAIKNQGDTTIKDQISRAFGLLSHAYRLQTKETLNALSLLKFGLDLDWLSGMSHEKINQLLFQCRRAHLIFAANNSLSGEDISQKRAEFLQGSMQNIRLKI